MDFRSQIRTRLVDVVFGTMVLILACYRALSSLHFGLHIVGRTLVTVILRDSVMYFAAIVATDLLCTVVWLKRSAVLFQTIVGPGLAVPSVLGSHLLLNLRGAYYQPRDVGTLTTRAFELPIVGTTAKMTSTSPVDTQWARYPDRDTHACSGPDTSTIYAAIDTEPAE